MPQIKCDIYIPNPPDAGYTASGVSVIINVPVRMKLKEFVKKCVETYNNGDGKETPISQDLYQKNVTFIMSSATTHSDLVKIKNAEKSSRLLADIYFEDYYSPLANLGKDNVELHLGGLKK